ncbi:MAG: hypothetical protein AB7T49_15885 [Oligoflexales bacterium]
MDRQWLKNLAESTFTGKSWKLPDSEAAKQAAASQLIELVPILFSDFKQAIETYNLYSKTTQLNILPLNSKGKLQLNGFALLGERHQLQVAQTGQELYCRLVSVNGFERREQNLFSVVAKVDPFGGIYWMQDNKTLISNELLIKNILTILVKAIKSNGNSTR